MTEAQSVPHYLGMHSKQPWFVLSALNKFSIIESKDKAISHFYRFRIDSHQSAMIAIPDGCIDILFDCDETNPTARVYGSLLEASSVKFLKEHRYIGVRFSPGVIPDFLKVSANDLINRSYNLLDVAPNTDALLERVVKQTCFEQQVNLIEQFLCRRMTLRSKFTLPVVKEICKTQGNMKVKDLEDLTGFSSRTIQRTFQQDMGITPKAFCQIIRCQSAVYKIHHDSIDFSDLAYELGFFDQSHFLRVFKRFINATPLEYQNSVRHEAYVKKIEVLKQTEKLSYFKRND